MIKSYSAVNEVGIPSEEELSLINKYALRPLKSDEVFVFSVILCDNDIDRDFERFSDDSLRNLEKLFVGKTGILNHSMHSEDQSARAYRTCLMTDKSRKTTDGREYMYLKAWCYTVRSDKNKDLISDIESGIKKEVSISCNSGGKTCSVCGKNSCSHFAGEKYNGKLCYKTIEDVTDAYEWSFVAVPAQKNAGVTKSAAKHKKERSMENVLKAIKTEKSLTLEGDDLKVLSDYINRLEAECRDGKKYRLSLETEAKKNFAIALPLFDGECAGELVEALPTDGLEKLCKALSVQAAKTVPAIPQLYKKAEVAENSENGQFKL